MAQKIDDIPPAVKNNVAPNFMFMLDDSGSMKAIVPPTVYNSATTYWGTCSGTSLIPTNESIDLRVINGLPRIRYGGANYRHSSITTATTPNNQAQRCFDNNATYTAALFADSFNAGTQTRSTTGGDAPYSGHFLNWYFGQYDSPTTPPSGWTDRKPSVAAQTRIEISRSSAITVINSLPLPPSVGASAPVRVGLSGYADSSILAGGRLLVPMQDLTTTSRTTLTTAINATTAAGNTPLAGTLADIGRYMATGYSGNVTLPNTSSVDLDTLLYFSGSDTVENTGTNANPIITPRPRNACLQGAPSCTDVSSARPIQQWCQRSSVFMLTDGQPNNDRVFNNNALMRDYDRDCSGGNVNNCGIVGPPAVAGNNPLAWDRKLNRPYLPEGSDYLDDVAKALFDIDLRPDLVSSTYRPAPSFAPAKPPGAKNNLITYMIGFADPSVQNDPLLLATGRQGGGKFISASDGPTLVDAFQDIITDAQAKNAAAAAVAVTNAQITAGSIGYASSYDSGSWFGNLQAYSLDISTGLRNETATDASWSAATGINARLPSTRIIVSLPTSGSTALDFTAANAASFSGLGPLPTGRTRAEVIDWLRGDRSLEAETVTNRLRQRRSALGDIINAEPVVVNYEYSGPGNGTTATVFQAANDGMLHVFDGRVDSSFPTRGQELWAYVPRLIHGKLGDLANANFSHKYLVDGTPATAQITGFGSMTRILVGGLGKGGSGYYALDITSGTADTAADAALKVKWEFNPANMGYSFGTPLIVNTATGWKVVLTSGYRNDSGSGGIGSGDGRGRVWVLNPNTGAIEKTFTTPAGSGESATDALGLAHLSKLDGTPEDAVVRFVYGGDLKGNLWRVDLDAASGAAPVRIAQLRGPTGAVQPVSSPPVVGPVAGSTSRFYVYVGTGQYFSDDDVPGTSTPNAFATQTQTMYGITDDTAVSAPALPTRSTATPDACSGGGNGTLVCQALTRPDVNSRFTVTNNAVDLSTKRGFYVDLPIANSRVNTEPALTSRGTLVFVANEPTNLVCNPGGNSYFFALSGATGGGVPRTIGGSTYFDAGYLLANALSSRPVLIRTGTGTRALLRLTDVTDKSETVPEPGNPTYKRIYKRALN